MPNRWSKSARIRKMQIEAGLDLTFCNVFLPFYLENIASCPNATLLEVGAGTGHREQAGKALGKRSVFRLATFLHFFREGAGPKSPAPPFKKSSCLAKRNTERFPKTLK